MIEERRKYGQPEVRCRQIGLAAGGYAVAMAKSGRPVTTSEAKEVGWYENGLDRSKLPSDEEMLPYINAPTVEQLRYCYSLPSDPPSRESIRANLCRGYRTANKFRDAFIKRWFGTSAYSSHDDTLAGCLATWYSETNASKQENCARRAVDTKIYRDLQKEEIPTNPPSSPYAKLLAKNTLMSDKEAKNNCLQTVDEVEGESSIKREDMCNHVAAVAVVIHKEIIKRRFAKERE
jgi:hypothetical protein